MSALAIFAGLAITIFGLYFIIGIATCLATDVYNRNARERQQSSSNYFRNREYIDSSTLYAVPKTDNPSKETTEQTPIASPKTTELRNRVRSEETHAADEG